MLIKITKSHHRAVNGAAEIKYFIEESVHDLNDALAARIIETGFGTLFEETKIVQEKLHQPEILNKAIEKSPVNKTEEVLLSEPKISEVIMPEIQENKNKLVNKPKNK
jgi:hypothetical protein